MSDNSKEVKYNSESNKSNKSPYSHLYFDDGENIKNDPFKDNIKKDPFNDNIIKSSTNNPQSIYYTEKNTKPSPKDFLKYKLNSQSEKDNKKLFIHKIRNDFNLLPTEYKKKVIFANSMFVVSSCIFPIYFLLNIVKDYPEITNLTKKRLIISTAMYFGFGLLVKIYFNLTYLKAYNNLRDKYSADEIIKIVDEYHKLNQPIILEENNEI